MINRLDIAEVKIGEVEDMVKEPIQNETSVGKKKTEIWIK